MQYTEEQLSLLGQLDGQLEHDPPRTPTLFKDVFFALHKTCGVPVQEISEGVKRPAETVSNWMNGTHIPNRPYRIRYASRIRTLIYKIMREHGKI